MLLGKRPRHPMQRTTSMTEFSFDDLTIMNPADQNPDGVVLDRDHQKLQQNHMLKGLVSPRMLLHRRNSADMAQSSSFLRTCALCSRRLAPGRDIFMYRGDSAFCSLECRQQQITQDEWKEKCTVLSSTNKESNSSSHTAGSNVSSTKGETVVAL